MKRLILATFALASVLQPMSAAAQQSGQAVVVSACGAQSYPTGTTRPTSQDATGDFCTNATGGGGGSNPAAGATGAAVPADASYNGLNVGGTLRGQTGVNPSGSVFASQNDVTSVNGVTTQTGPGAAGTGSQRVSVGQDTTTIAGSAPGTAGTPSTNVVSVQGVASGTVIPDTGGGVAQGSTTSGQTGALIQGAVTTSAPSYTTAQTSPLSITPNGALRVLDNNSAALLTAAQSALPAQSSHGVNVGGVEGLAAQGAAVTGDPLLNGGRAATAQPTAVTDGQASAIMVDPLGKTVTKPYSPAGLDWQGAASTTGNTAVTLEAAGAAGIRNYLTGLQCSRNDTGTTPITITLNDSSTWVLDLINYGDGGSFQMQFATPLKTAAATALTFTVGTNTTTVKCNGQGYQAP